MFVKKSLILLAVGGGDRRADGALAGDWCEDSGRYWAASA